MVVHPKFDLDNTETSEEGGCQLQVGPEVRAELKRRGQRRRVSDTHFLKDFTRNFR